MTTANLNELELKGLPDEVVSEIVKLAAIGAAVAESAATGERMSLDEMVDLVEMHDLEISTPSATLAIAWLETL